MSTEPDPPGEPPPAGRPLSQAGLATAQAQAAAAAQRLDPDAVAPTGVVYIGLATRTIAFAVDAALIDVAGALAWIATWLILSILHVPDTIETITYALLAALTVLWAIAYFVTFWSTTGQTPGSRLLQIRVRDEQDRGHLSPRRALLRFGALVLAALPLFLGLAPILFDPRRRGFHDRVARTIVVDAPRLTAAERRRMAAAAQTPRRASSPSSSR